MTQREEMWESFKKSLDNLLLYELSCETGERFARTETNMPLLNELEKRIKELNDEITELDRRKRILAGQVNVLQRAADVVVKGELAALDEEPVTSKAEIVRSLIRQAGPNGISRDDIREELERQGQSLAKNYVYSTLARLREDGEISQMEDRYFWSKKN
jgi:hypothetical protein